MLLGHTCISKKDGTIVCCIYVKWYRDLQDLAKSYIQIITVPHKSKQSKMKSVATKDNQPNEDTSLSYEPVLIRVEKFRSN
jgi:hypothetical protein